MSRGRLLSFAVLAPAVVLTGVAVQAASIVVQDDVNDYEAQRRSNTGEYIASENNGFGRVGHQSNFNGSGTFPPGGIQTIFLFQLPVLNPGDTLNSASFSVGLVPDSATSAVTPTFNGDAYVLGVTDTVAKDAAEAQNFFYLGNTAQTSLPTPIGGSVSRFADDFLVPGDFIANGGTESASPKTADLTSYIQNLYADPSGNGFTPGTSFLVVRINGDANPPPTSGTQRYALAWAGTGPSGNGGAGAEAIRPMITIDVVPEPGSLGVFAIAGTALGLRRRGRQRHH
jgi:hypothetical protein